jgi:hypothetical protein
MTTEQRMWVFLTCGLLSASIAYTIGFVGFVAFDCITWQYSNELEILVPRGWRPHFINSVLHGHGEVFLRGLPFAAGAGMPAAIAVRVVSHMWHKIQPSRLAILLSAALVVNCFLVYVVVHTPLGKAEVLLISLLIALAMIVGAIYGFLLIFLFKQIEKRMINPVDLHANVVHYESAK